MEERGVKEIWIWGYHGGVVDLWESNMAGPWGDISNSDRDPHDLPVFDRTYTVYHYNYQRGPSEAVEDHMHQIEAMLRHVDPELFWNKFVGKPGEGRCGWAHFPPNGVRDYDWRNPNRGLDRHRGLAAGRRRAEGPASTVTAGTATACNGSSTGCRTCPGPNNGITYRGRPLTNWWTFIGDFDARDAGAAGAGGVAPSLDVSGYQDSASASSIRSPTQRFRLLRASARL